MQDTKDTRLSICAIINDVMYEDPQHCNVFERNARTALMDYAKTPISAEAIRDTWSVVEQED